MFTVSLEEGKEKAKQMMKEAKAEFWAHASEWKEKTPAYLEACRKVEMATRMCNSYGVRY